MMNPVVTHTLASLLITMLVLSNPKITTAPLEQRPFLIEGCRQLEIMDQDIDKKKDIEFFKPIAYDWEIRIDLSIMRNRYLETKDLPGTNFLDRMFEEYDFFDICNAIEYCKNRKKSLDLELSAFPNTLYRREIEKTGALNVKYMTFWNKIADAKNAKNSISNKRDAYKKALTIIGEEKFYNREFPTIN